MTVAEQAQAFAAMALCGACVGAGYDLLAVFRRSALLTAAADLTLGMLGALGIIAIGLVLRCNPFRMYTPLGIAAGWTIYALTLGTIVRVLARLFLKLSKKVAN